MRRFFYYSFRGLTAIQYRMKKRFTAGGFFVLSGLVISALFGLDTSRTMIYQAFAFLLSLMTVSLLYSRFLRARFTVQRIIPRFGTVGVPLEYRVLVRNEISKTQRGLSLIESLKDPIPSYEEFIQSFEPNEERRSRFDRYVGYFRWQWLISQKTRGRMTERPLPPIPADGTVEVRCEVTPCRRGELDLTGVTITRKDPFGLVRTPFTVHVAQTIQVLPRRYPLPPIRLPGVPKYQRGGVAMASSVGESEEFVSLREYRAGDPLRRIHWKSWAKTGRPVVREYQEEFFVRHALILDTFLHSGNSEVFEEAVSVTASFASSIQTMESLLDLMFVGGESYCFTAGRALASMEKILEILSSVQLCRDKSFKTLRHSVINRISLISGCICILVSWDEERRDFIEQLKMCGVPLLVLVVGDSNLPDPLDPGPMRDNPSCFHRLEVGKIKEGLSRI